MTISNTEMAKLVYTVSVSLLALLPAVVSFMANFYYSERMREGAGSWDDLKWLRTVIYLFIGVMWLIVVASLISVSYLRPLNGGLNIQMVFMKGNWMLWLITSATLLLAGGLTISMIYFFRRDRVDWND